MGTSQLQ